MMGYFTPNIYAHEAWYLGFLVALVLNLLILWASLVIEAMRRGFEPRTGAMMVGGLGILLAMTPSGFGVWAAFNLVIWSLGVPLKFSIVSTIFAISVFVNFWITLFPSVLAQNRSQRHR